jgi:N-acyl-L-homoserine lactone synthetase
MTVINPEAGERGVEPPLRLRVIDKSDEDAFSQWLTVRRTFVEAQGWRYGDDTDAYDADEATLHIVSAKDREIAAGLRLTPCEHPEKTLSWSMLSGDMQSAAREHLPSDDPVGVWDLTRLVVGEIDKEMVVEAFFEMLGAGMALTERLDEAPRWYFTTTLPLYVFFQQQGVGFTPVVKGKISESDTYDSVFCYADPAERTAWLQSAPGHRANYEAVVRGVKMIQQGRVS